MGFEPRSIACSFQDILSHQTQNDIFPAHLQVIPAIVLTPLSLIFTSFQYPANLLWRLNSNEDLTRVQNPPGQMMRWMVVLQANPGMKKGGFSHLLLCPWFYFTSSCSIKAHFEHQELNTGFRENYPIMSLVA